MNTLPTLSYIEAFLNDMANFGIVFNGKIIPDSDIHRFHIKGDRLGSKNGWYVMYLNPIPMAFYGTWKTGVQGKWSLKPYTQLSQYEKDEYRRKVSESIHQAREMQRQQHERAAIKANNILSFSFTADEFHPYLVKKRIRPFTARQNSNSLILPICDFKGNLWSLQFISAHGDKKLLSGGVKKGMHIPIYGSMQSFKTLLICEGFATGATLANLYPETSVIAAIDAGNLESVAINARIHFPKAEIIICADDDRNTKGNPGLTYGRLAAAAVGASFLTPSWPAGSPETLTDFNDLACWLEDHEGIVI